MHLTISINTESCQVIQTDKDDIYKEPSRKGDRFSLAQCTDIQTILVRETIPTCNTGLVARLTSPA